VEQVERRQVDKALKKILTELQDVKELQDYSSAKIDLATHVLKVKLPDISRKILAASIKPVTPTPPVTLDAEPPPMDRRCPSCKAIVFFHINK